MELRKDYILDRWVIYSTERTKRPREFKKEKTRDKSVCFFCPGNENLTPPEIGRVEKKGKWIVRWFPNKFPFVAKNGDVEIEVKSRFFNSEFAYGYHEVITECREHKKQMWDLPKEQIKQISEVYRDRILGLTKLWGIKYVVVFKNHGKEAGTSLAHSHSQVAAINMIPTFIKEEISAIRKYDSCPYCDIINIEKKGKRKCFENKTFLAFAPYASRFSYEVWLFPKRHVANITELSDKEMTGLADILKKVLIKLKKINASYNFFLHYAQKSNFHFHIEITPRIGTCGGFENSTGILVNSVTPENAAEFYRK